MAPVAWIPSYSPATEESDMDLIPLLGIILAAFVVIVAGASWQKKKKERERQEK